MLLLEALALYAAPGLVVALAFVVFGVARVVPHGQVTVGARVLLIPGATLLWPLILGRWLKAPTAP